MKIVRVLWGDPGRFWSEIPARPVFGDEFVFVWGNTSADKLAAMGYRTIVMNDIQLTHPEFSTPNDQYAHKLLALSMAEMMWDEYLFLDWDVKVVRPIDTRFWDLIRNRGPVQCPVYAYPFQYQQKFQEHVAKTGLELDPNIHTWIESQQANLLRYSWELDENHVLPCFCFFYSRGAKAATKLFDIYKANRLVNCIEEFAMYCFAQSSLEDYIEQYEPIVIRGRENEYAHFDMPSCRNVSTVLNSRVDELIHKDIYLKHI
jgi:hypothetical protein